MPGETLTFTKQRLADACKAGGYAAVGTSNQGRCVDVVEHTFPTAATLVVSGGGPVGGLIATVYSDGNGGLIANWLVFGGRALPPTPTLRRRWRTPRQQSSTSNGTRPCS